MFPDEQEGNAKYNVVNFLHKTSNIVTHIPPILKSYYGCRLRVLEKRSSVYIEDNSLVKAHCPRCSMRYSEVGVSNTLKPEKKLTRFAKKILSKANAQQRLTKYQAKYLETVKRKPLNRLVATCQFCKKESTYQVAKPARIQSDGLVKLPAIKLPKKATKRRKKRSDKFCGLNTDAVLSVQKSTPCATSRPKEKTVNKVISKKQKKKMRNNVDKLALILTTLPEKRNASENLAHFLTSR